jgi:hypothetical protein
VRHVRRVARLLCVFASVWRGVLLSRVFAVVTFVLSRCLRARHAMPLSDSVRVSGESLSSSRSERGYRTRRRYVRGVAWCGVVWRVVGVRARPWLRSLTQQPVGVQALIAREADNSSLREAVAALESRKSEIQSELQQVCGELP